LLPGNIFVGDFEIPEGVYDLRIEFLNFEGRVIDVREIPSFDVRLNDFNLVETIVMR
jgi:hypothetical protein